MDDLEQLLAKADAPTPPVRSDLANAVRQVVSRRRRKRRAIASAAVVLLVGAVGVATLKPREHLKPESIAVHRIDVDAVRKEIADLDAEAKLHMRIALAIEQEMSRDDQLEAAQHTLSQPDVLLQVDERRQVAAQLMLSHAEQLAADPSKHDEATANYRKLVALFPDTLASRAASNRLRAVGT
jgi:hypothetical protein